MPTAGGIYYWSSKLGGPAWGWSAFNYAPLVTRVVIVAVTVWYLTSARKTFQGPVWTIAFEEDGVTVAGTQPIA